MINYKISDITPDMHFHSDVLLDTLFLISTPPCPISESILSLLKQWGFKELFSDDEKILSKIQEKEKPKSEAKKIDLGETETVDFSEFMEDDSSSSIPEDQIPEQFKQSEEVDLSEFTDSFSEPPAQENPAAEQTASQAQGAAAPQRIPPEAQFGFSPEQNAISAEEDKTKTEQAKKTYEKFMEFISDIYTKYATKKIISQPEINGKVLELCNFTRENKKFILRISPNFETQDKNFLISHSMRTTVLSIVIGLQLKMPYERIIELGVASILHEIGQIRLPPQLYMNSRILSPSEKSQMRTHTLLGYNIAKEAGLPLTIQFGILDHHERENGTGYPRHLAGSSISLYAKIIGVACSFEAITAPRQFRDAKTTYEGMIEMLKNKNHLYDDTIVKALLLSLSMYPIGAFVFLSNGRVAQVIDVSPSSPKNPIVQIVGSINPDGTPKQIQTDDSNIKIVRVMNSEESADLKKALGEIPPPVKEIQLS